MTVWNELRIQNAVLRKICDDNFTASRPDVPREKYKSIRNWVDDKHENERLETVGDSILLACLTLRMYKYKDATPMVITKLRSVLLSNMVLALVAEKSDPKLPGAHKSLLNEVQELLQRERRGEQVKVRLPKSRFKPTADRLEALIAALHMTHGLDSARRWFDHTFDPLIKAGMDSNRARTLSTASVLAPSPLSSLQKGKKRLLEDAATSSRSAKRLRAEGGQAIPASHHKGKAKERTVIPDDAVIIDLTVDDFADDSDELNADAGDDEESDNDHTIIDLTADDSDSDEDDSDEDDEHLKSLFTPQVNPITRRKGHPLPRRPHWIAPVPFTPVNDAYPSTGFNDPSLHPGLTEGSRTTSNPSQVLGRPIKSTSIPALSPSRAALTANRLPVRTGTSGLCTPAMGHALAVSVNLPSGPTGAFTFTHPLRPRQLARETTRVSDQSNPAKDTSDASTSLAARSDASLRRDSVMDKQPTVYTAALVPLNTGRLPYTKAAPMTNSSFALIARHGFANPCPPIRNAVAASTNPLSDSTRMSLSTHAIRPHQLASKTTFTSGPVSTSPGPNPANPSKAHLVTTQITEPSVSTSRTIPLQANITRVPPMKATSVTLKLPAPVTKFNPSRSLCL